MSKPKSMFVCQSCGWVSARWAGQCGSCGEWNTMVEQAIETNQKEHKSTSKMVVTPMKQVKRWKDGGRIPTTIGELDRVLGGEPVGGLVPGEVVLLGGEPGIGKSTLLSQVAIGMLTNSVQKDAVSRTIAYVAGEESPQQISLRLERLFRSRHNNKIQTKDEAWQDALQNLMFVTSTDVDQICQFIAKEKPSLVIVDSIQTMVTTDLTGSAGSIGQVRESADRLTTVAKAHHVPLFLVGHVTKDGKLAGPMVLEHLVDTVLELKGEKTSELRILRSQKNRFGATDEVGVFRMTEMGYQEVSNPSEYFLELREKDEPGSAVSCVIEGSRPLLIEVQALVVSSSLPQPRRVGRGISSNRLQILTAVLEKHAKLPLSGYDIYVSLAGGYESREPSLDLAICMAIASSYAGKPSPLEAVYVGEVGLLGEIRTAPLMERRTKEAKRLGYSAIYSREQAHTVQHVISSQHQRKA